MFIKFDSKIKFFKFTFIKLLQMLNLRTSSYCIEKSGVKSRQDTDQSISNTHSVLFETGSCHRERNDMQSSWPCTDTDHPHPRNRSRRRARQTHGHSKRPRATWPAITTTRTLCSGNCRSCDNMVIIIRRMIASNVNK